MRKWLITTSLATVALAATGCSGEEQTQLTCGPNTILVDGQCVTNIRDIACAEGTTRDEDTGECIADVQCGAGTTYNAVTGECEPDSRCGEGTTLDPDTGLCEPDSECGPETTLNPDTGECEPNIRCGANTVLSEDGVCEPVPRCGTGTHFNADTGTCSADLTCGPGLQSLNDQCLTPNEIVSAGADASETLPDANDPALGGTPESLTLEAIGSQAVFTGNFDRVFDDEETQVQDIDVWSFTGMSGQRLRIRILSMGAPQPTFLLSGPEGYERSSAIGTQIDADREVVLPYDGTYELLIAPAAFRLANPGAPDVLPLPMGGEALRYVGIIEEVGWPSARPLTLPSTAGESVELSGSVQGLSDNFVQVLAPASTSFKLEVSSEGVATVPILMLFTADGTFVTERMLEKAENLPTGSHCDAAQEYIDCHSSAACLGGEGLLRIGACETSTPYYAADETYFTSRPEYLIEEDNFILLIDWVFATGPSTDFQMKAAPADVAVSAGAVAVDDDLLAGPVDVLTGQMAIITVAAEQGQVITPYVVGEDTPLVFQTIGPEGTVLFETTATTEEELTFLAPTTGEYTFVYLNRDIEDSTGLTVTFISQTPLVPAGLVYDGTAPVSAVTDFPVIEPRRDIEGLEWLRVDVGVPALLEMNWVYKQGLPHVTVYELDAASGARFTYRDISEDIYPTHRIDVSEPRVILVRVSTGLGGQMPDPAVRELSLAMAIDAMPTMLEVEPNDDNIAPMDLGAIGTGRVQLLGTISEPAKDVYTFTIDPSLAANEILRIQAHNLESAGETIVRLYDASFAEIFTNYGSGVTTDASTSRVFPWQGTGPFFVEVEGSSQPFEEEYVLDFVRETVKPETEPNNAWSEPVDLGTLDAFPVVAAGVTNSADHDWWSFTLADGTLAADEALWIRFDNLMGYMDLDPVLYASDGTTKLGTVEETEDGVILRRLAAGTYLLDVAGENADRDEFYRISIYKQAGVYDAGTDDANSTDISGAAVLPLLSLGGSTSTWGWEVKDENAYYSFSLDAAPAANQVVIVRFEAANERGDILFRVLDSAQTELFNVAQYRGELAFVPTDQGPYYVEIIPGQSTEASQAYYLEGRWIDGVQGEIEDNGTDAAAQPITLPAMIRGQTRSYYTSTTTPQDADPDVYTTMLAAPLAAGESLVASVRSLLSRADLLTIKLRDSTGTELDTATHFDPVVSVTGTTETTFYIEIVGGRDDRNEVEAYEASVAVVSP